MVFLDETEINLLACFARGEIICSTPKCCWVGIGGAWLELNPPKTLRLQRGVAILFTNDCRRGDGEGATVGRGEVKLLRISRLKIVFKHLFNDAYNLQVVRWKTRMFFGCTDRVFNILHYLIIYKVCTYYDRFGWNWRREIHVDIISIH